MISVEKCTIRLNWVRYFIWSRYFNPFALSDNYLNLLSFLSYIILRVHRVGLNWVGYLIYLIFNALSILSYKILKLHPIGLNWVEYFIYSSFPSSSTPLCAFRICNLHEYRIKHSNRNWRTNVIQVNIKSNY